MQKFIAFFLKLIHIIFLQLGERPYICKQCGKGFVHKHYLIEHMDYHTGERKYQCPQCGKRFQSASTLSKHAERHKGLRNHQCSYCSKSFLGLYLLYFFSLISKTETIIPKYSIRKRKNATFD